MARSIPGTRCSSPSSNRSTTSLKPETTEKASVADSKIGFEVVAGGAAARMVIGEVDLDLLYDRLMTAEAELGRVVNVTVFTTPEWASDDSGFVRHVRKQPVVRLIGPGDD